MASFGPIAPHYDLLMSQIPYDMWAGYYRLLLSRMECDPDTLLDACCGTGSVAEILSQQGYEVVGFDLSPEMIAVAKDKAARLDSPVEYLVADACTLDLGRTFEGAYSFFDSLNYITDPGAAESAIHRIGAHIQPGGSFVFDLNTAYAFEEKMFDQHDLRKKAEIRYDWKGDYDPATRVIRVDMTFWRGDTEFKEFHIQRAHTHEEVVAWLSAAGFVRMEWFESYTMEPPRHDTDRVHYCAIKG